MAHNKVYAVCENMCMEETYTKEQINEKLNNINEKLNNIIVKSDIAVLNGEIDIEAGETAISELNYPSGFTASNTIVLETATTSGTGANSIYGYPSNATLGNVSDPRVTLLNNKIQFEIPHNLSSGRVNLYYKIVLMKIS